MKGVAHGLCAAGSGREQIPATLTRCREIARGKFVPWQPYGRQSLADVFRGYCYVLLIFKVPIRFVQLDQR